MTVLVTLVRHGRTSWNAEGRLLGWRDVGLDRVGTAEAEALAARLAGSDFDAAWSSDLRRARETAAVIGTAATTDQRLREFDFGRLEGSTWEELAPETQEALVAFDGFAARCGETVSAFRRRVVDFMDGLAEGRHLVVTHGGVIRVVLAACGDRRSRSSTGSITTVDWPHRHIVVTPSVDGGSAKRN